MGNEYIFLVVIEHIHRLMDRMVRTRSERVVILQDRHVPSGTEPYAAAIKAVRDGIAEDDEIAKQDGMERDPDYDGFEVVEVRQLTNAEVIGSPVNGREVPV